MRQLKRVTAKMVVSVSGAWLENGKQVTPAKIEKAVREVLKDEFDSLDAKVTVRRVEGEK